MGNQGVKRKTRMCLIGSFSLIVFAPFGFCVLLLAVLLYPLLLGLSPWAVTVVLSSSYCKPVKFAQLLLFQ